MLFDIRQKTWYCHLDDQPPKAVACHAQVAITPRQIGLGSDVHASRVARSSISATSGPADIQRGQPLVRVHRLGTATRVENVHRRQRRETFTGDKESMTITTPAPQHPSNLFNQHPRTQATQVTETTRGQDTEKESPTYRETQISPSSMIVSRSTNIE